MKAYDLKPTIDNLLDTYEKDIIERNPDVFRFTEILDSIEDGCTIALDGNWGSGKTFFVKQVKMVMDAHNGFIDLGNDENIDKIVAVRKRYYKSNIFDLQPQVCVYYDAWENDNDDDPVMSLVYTILNSVESNFNFKDGHFIDTAASIMEVFSGRNWPQLIEQLKGTSPLNSLKEHKEVELLVGEFLDSLIPEKGNRLVVFIDELDRCKPSYAVRLLERIKHYFTNDRITFVFSVNVNELQHTIRKCYGDDFDSSRYLDRFFDLWVTLPPPNMKNYYQSLNFSDSHYTFDIVCDAVIKTYHFELREIAKYLRLTKIAAYKPTHGEFHFVFPDERAMEFCSFFVVPVMLGLRMTNAQRYTEFINGKDGSSLVEIAENVKFLGFMELLNQNETYDQDDADKVCVTLADKIRDVYNAIFVTSYTGPNYRTMIGSLKFDARTKNALIRTTSLLSQNTNLDTD